MPSVLYLNIFISLFTRGRVTRGPYPLTKYADTTHVFIRAWKSIITRIRRGSGKRNKIVGENNMYRIGRVRKRRYYIRKRNAAATFF